MKILNKIFSKGLAQGFALFSSTKKRKHRRSKTRRNRKRNSRRHLMRGG